MVKCLYCGSKLEVKEGHTKLNPARKYCDSTCQARAEAKKYYEEHKDDPKFMKKRSDFFKNVWYPQNKEKQRQNILNNYYENKDEWKERSFTNKNKARIMLFINPFCSCGKTTQIIFHKRYGHRPLMKLGAGDETRLYNLKMIKKYTKENLIGVCSKLCLEKEKKR